MTLLFYISGHGFGHASRQVEILRALVGREPRARIVIRSAVNPDLLRRTLDVPFLLEPGPCDTGIVQRTSIEHDDDATVLEAIQFYERYEERIAAEAGRATAFVPSLIVGDIPPIAFEVASRLGVPGIAIGNFTWDWIYQTHPGMTGRAPWIPGVIRASYQKARHALALPFSGGFEVFPSAERIPLVARRSLANRAETRRHFGLPARGRVAEEAGDPLAVLAALAGPIERVAAETIDVLHVAARPRSRTGRWPKNARSRRSACGAERPD